jgi:hypothetical protein
MSKVNIRKYHNDWLKCDYNGLLDLHPKTKTIGTIKYTIETEELGTLVITCSYDVEESKLNDESTFTIKIELSKMKLTLPINTTVVYSLNDRMNPDEIVDRLRDDDDFLSRFTSNNESLINSMCEMIKSVYVSDNKDQWITHKLVKYRESNYETKLPELKPVNLSRINKFVNRLFERLA